MPKSSHNAKPQPTVRWVFWSYGLQLKEQTLSMLKNELLATNVQNVAGSSHKRRRFEMHPGTR